MPMPIFYPIRRGEAGEAEILVANQTLSVILNGIALPVAGRVGRHLDVLAKIHRWRAGNMARNRGSICDLTQFKASIDLLRVCGSDSRSAPRADTHGDHSRNDQ